MIVFTPIGPFIVRFEQAQKNKSDFPEFLSQTIIASKKALMSIYPLIKDNVELLPILVGKETFHAINVIKVIDCLDHENSTFKRFSNGRIMKVIKFQFKDDCIKENTIFKIPEQVRNKIYVSDGFKRFVEQHHLTGLMFTKVFG